MLFSGKAIRIGFLSASCFHSVPAREDLFMLISMLPMLVKRYNSYTTKLHTGGDPASKFRWGDFSNIWESSLIMGSLL